MDDTCNDGIMGTDKNDPELDSPETPWSKSNAKKHLKKEIIAGKLTGMKPKEVYMMNKAYQVYKLENFRNNFIRLKEGIKNNQNNAAWDHEALIHDREIHPFPTVTPQGYPVWHRSEAEGFLKDDVKGGLHKTMTSLELFNSRPSYQLFPLRIFKKHVTQEKRSLTDKAYWRWLQDKRKDRKDKKG
jgi:hypothetical protein